MAGALGVDVTTWTLRRLLAAWDYRAKIEKELQRAAWTRAALVCCTIANVNRPKGRKAYRPADFMPTWPGEKPRGPRGIPLKAKNITDLKALLWRNPNSA